MDERSEGTYTPFHMRTFSRVLIAIGLLCITASAGIYLYRLIHKPTPTDHTQEDPQKHEIRLSLFEEDANTPIPDTTPIPPESDFFKQNASVPKMITNAEFQQLIDSGTDFVAMDPREDEEYAIGRFPDALHIRYADLRTGEWTKIPKDKVVIVFCYSGIRGEIVANFLRSRGIVARYLENGLSDWFEKGGKWNGDIDFYAVYADPHYYIPMTGAEYKKHQADGAYVLDIRPEYIQRKQAFGPVDSNPGSVTYMPMSILEETLAKVPKDRPIITVCRDISSCFDATEMGIKLEKRGHTFLGLYEVTEKTEGFYYVP